MNYSEMTEVMGMEELIAVKRNLIYELVTREAMKVSCAHNSLIVVALYRPPNSDCDYAVRLTDSMESIAKKYPKEVIWMGSDANSHDIDWSSNSDLQCEK